MERDFMNKLNYFKENLPLLQTEPHTPKLAFKK